MKPLQLFLLYLLTTFFAQQVVAQNCSISFDGEANVCTLINTSYSSTIPSTITSVEWQLDGLVISDEENVDINWKDFNDGTYNLCLITSDSCNNLPIDPFCQMITISPIRVDSTVTLCNGRSIRVRNQFSPQRDTFFTLEGTHFYTYVAANGCDSIVAYHLTKIPSPTIILPDSSICAGDFYELGDSMYTTSGRKQQFIADEEGCFTDFILNLEVRDPIETLIPELVCIEDLPYEIWDTMVIETSIFDRVFIAADGCDSTVIVDLTVLPIIDTLILDTLCAEGTYPIGDTIYNTTGMHIYTFENGSYQGCDSIVIIDLIVKEIIETDAELTLCEGEELLIDQDIVSLDFQPDTDIVGVENVRGIATSRNGCDSTINYTITVNPTSFTKIDTSLCFDSSIMIGGNVFFSSTANVITLRNQYGCDSIVDYVVRSTATQPIEFTFEQTLCPETDDLFIGDSLISETGHYEIILPSYTGCDSLVIADIIAYKEEDLTHIFEDVLCTGLTYTKIEGRFLTEGGTYVFDHLESASTGCDSVIVLTLIEQEGDNSSESVTENICAGDFFVHPNFPKDTLRTESIHPLSTIFPETCENFDLVVTIVFKDSIHVSTSEILCEGDSIAVGDRFYKEAGIFIDTLRRSGPVGCDSIITTTIELRDCNIEIEEDIKPSECNGESTGSIEFEVITGKPPLLYELILPDSGVIATGTIDNLFEPILFDSLAIGNYTLILEDTVNAFKEFFLEVDQPNEFTVDWNPSEFNRFNLACEGDDNGTLELLPVTNLTAGSYTVTITDNMDCEYIESFEMIEPDPLAPNIMVDFPNCFDLSAGEIVVRSIDGGVAPYSYKMGGHPTFSTQRSYAELSPGEYTIITKDDNGCTSEFVADLPEPEIPELLFESDVFIDLGEEITPNGDGLNDRLVIFGGPEVSSIVDFEVFDRWGSSVFSRSGLAPNVEEGTWDGTFKGRRVRSGSFVWMARIAFIDGEVLEYFGDVVVK